MTRLCLRALLAMSTVILAASAGGCSDAPLNHSSADVGGVSVSLSIGGGETINSASYSITGPAAFTNSGTIDLSNSTSVAVTLGGIPAGSGYNITLTATTTDGSISCGGSATFTVTAGQTVSVVIALSCQEAPHKGSVQVTGTLNICPTIDSLSTSTNDVIVGASIALTSTAHDTDSGPGPLTYSWMSTSGTFNDPASPNPTFTCTAPGAVTLTLVVSDGDPNTTCVDSLQVLVTCVAPPGP